MKTRENELHEPIIKIKFDIRYLMKLVEITCSVCGNTLDKYYSEENPAKIRYPNYCPYCGARLKDES